MRTSEDRLHTEPPQSEERLRARDSLIERLGAESGVRDARILEAFSRVPRHAFVRPSENDYAYTDVALPIGFKQTISQPSMIALMLDGLGISAGERVLEVGGGSGYAAALMAELGAEVFTLEIVAELAQRATRCLSDLGYDRVHVLHRDGRLGLPEHAPYDAIMVSAAAESVPDELLHELGAGGRIAIPVGGSAEQQLLVGRKSERGAVSWQRSVPCIFVPLVSGA
ncbi:MAG: protein-L-isoaspartate(D-aspartate) O-methyltransferase [Polyangiaceae bacterium]